MTDFLEYVLSLDPVLFHCYALGHHNDLAGYDRAVTATNLTDRSWRRDKRGHGIYFGDVSDLAVADRLSVAHGAEQQVSDFSLILFCRPIRYQESTSWFIQKRTGADTQFGFSGTASALRLRTGGDTSSLTVDRLGARMLGATLAPTAKPDFYIDGVNVGQGDTDLGSQDVSTPVTIGNFNTGNGAALFAMQAAIVIPSQIDDAAMSALWRLWLEDARGVPAAPLVPVQFAPVDRNGALLYLSGGKDSSGDVIDQGPSGLDAAVSGRVTEERDAQSSVRGQRFHGAGQGVVTVPVSAALTGKTAQTFAMILRRDSSGEGTTGRAFDFDGFTTLRNVAALFTFFRRFDDGNARWNYVLSPNYGHIHHHLVQHDGDPTNLPEAWINGRPVTMAVSTARSGALSDDAGAQLYFGNRASLANTGDGFIGHMKMFGGASLLSAAQVRAEYLQYATRMIELAPRRAYPITLANRTSGQVGPWSIGSGTWSYQDDGAKRKVVVVGPGKLTVPSSQAYGAWYWRMKKTDASSFWLMIVAANRSLPFGAGSNGYMFRVRNSENVILGEVSGGAFSTLFSTGNDYIDPDTEYEWLLTRAFDGYIVLWVRSATDPNFPTWTEVGNTADTTHTTSKFIVAEIDADDELSDVRFYPLGDTLDPSANEIPGLED